MKLKVCGMKYNATAVAALKPDYLGFIFWKPSARVFEGDIPRLPPGIRAVGVFVDTPLRQVVHTASSQGLNAIQLHGEESAEYCRLLQEQLSPRGGGEGLPQHPQMVQRPKIIKVFRIRDNFDFSALRPFEDVCDYYLFDTRGKLPGGNGLAFDWEVLNTYPSVKPFFLSGGIGPGDTGKIRDFFAGGASRYCHGIDVNSRFEVRPGEKDIATLREFIKGLGGPIE